MSHSNKSRQLFLATIVALVSGGVAGVLFGTATEPLGALSLLVVQALRAIAVPLLFFAIVDALVKSHLSLKGFGKLVMVAAINALLAVTIGIAIVNSVEPGQHLGFIREAIGSSGGGAAALPVTDWQKTISSLMPSSMVEPFVKGDTPAVIMLALAFGIALRRLGKAGSVDERASVATLTGIVAVMFRVLIMIIDWLVYLVPIAVFCAVAKAVGKSGLAVAGGLGVFLVVCIGGMVVQILLTYQSWVLLHPRIRLRQFWRAAREPASYAFGINSSLATMPVTLEALEDLGVSEEAARLSTCVGTNFNNDGILLYEVVAALILAQAFGHDLSLGHQLYVALISIVATIGVAGFPEAGVVALTLVLTAIGLPPEAIVMLMSVDWIIARCRSATNVVGDMAVGVAIDRFLTAKSR